MEFTLVCSRLDVQRELGGEEFAEGLLGDPRQIDAALTDSLSRVLSRLATSVPPVLAGSLSDPTELKWVVIYGALATLFRQRATTGEDINSIKGEQYQKLYDSNVRALRPTVYGESRAPNLNIAIHRR